MDILLIKCHVKTLFSVLSPIKTEPLELEYIESLLTSMDINSYIYDSNFSKSNLMEVLKKTDPKIVILNGYVTASNNILHISKKIKHYNKNIKIIVGGVYAQINPQDFFIDSIDYIVHSQSLLILKDLINAISNNFSPINISGIAFKNHESNTWQINNKHTIKDFENIIPSRKFLYSNIKNTKYLNYQSIALLKTSVSCPFSCEFCYCRLLNNSHYFTRDNIDIINEIRNINSEYIWIIDDTFLVDRQKILDFCDLILKNNISKKFIAYSRSDFISKNHDIIKLLRSIGFIDIIVGMESIDNQTLNAYNKQISLNQNESTISILKENNINLTALFIVNHDYDLDDFRKLRAFIKIHKLKVYTLSIFTPMKGTEIYQHYESKLNKCKYKNFDFLHLLIKPTKMSYFRFYLEFYLTYSLQILYNKDYLRFILNKLKGV